VQTIDGKSVVFVKVEKGFKVQPVKIGSSDGKLVEIVEGLPAGSQYAASNSFVVKAEQGKGSAGHED
jgi:cobalt-zinc-cadmium efflux system membrane fusion protein